MPFDPNTDPRFTEQINKLKDREPRSGNSPNVPSTATNQELPTVVEIPRDTLPPVLPYDLELLPPVIRNWVWDEVERGQFPPDFVAVTALACMGSVIGRRCAIYLKKADDWHEFPNLWSAIIGRPGSKKSPSMGVALGPLRKLERDYSKENEDAKQAFEKEQERSKIIRKAQLKRAEKTASSGGDFDIPDYDSPSPPVPKRLITSDPTEEKLGELLAGNPMGMVMELDELAVLDAMFEKSPSLREFLLKSWSGKESHTVDRIVRGTLFVPSLCMSVIGGIQPGRIAARVRQAQRDDGADGLLQRFQLIAYPDPLAGSWMNVDRPPDSFAKNEAYTLFYKIASMAPSDFPDGPDGMPNGLRFSDDAYLIFIDWLTTNQNVIRMCRESEAMESYLAKAPKAVGALALTLQLFDDPTSREVGVDAVRRAISLYEIGETHIRRLLECHRVTGPDAAYVILAKLREGKLNPCQFTARQIKRKNWRGLNDAESVEEGLATLVECGWIQASPVRGAGEFGRPSFTYHVNPSALKKLDEPSP